MRLLHLDSQGTSLMTTEFVRDVPHYAILSHTWGADEIMFADLHNGQYRNKSGYSKIKFCVDQARKDGISYCWVDTCCIDKTNSAELSEAINSCFRWYAESAICYVHLSDVSTPKKKQVGISQLWLVTFRKSRWFTRGWTLSELLAPKKLVFYSRDFDLLGTKSSFASRISQFTGIPFAALQGQSLSQFTIEQRFGWAKTRQTTLSEDRAYSLLGIFDVIMPIIYGEGEIYAFYRLQKEIERRDDLDGDPHSVRLSGEVSNILPDQANDKPRFSALGKSGFRLLNLNRGVIGEYITGHIQEHSLNSPPAYYALSYVWGQEPPVHRTILNGEEVHIQPNLLHALQRVRLRDGEYLIWVDTLCINQNDSSERSHQVKQMSQIYNSAAAVMIWLGEEDATSNLALEFMSKVTSDEFRWGELWWEEHGFVALAQLFERPWFQRGWVLQEAAFSKNSIVHCGDQEIHMDHFITAVKTVQDRLSAVSLSSGQILSNLDDSPATRLIHTITNAIRKGARRGPLRRAMSLEDLVYRNVHSETTDPRDAIYSLLNLANDVATLENRDRRDSIVPDYTKPVLDVFADFVQHCCLRSGQLDVICHPWAPVLRVGKRVIDQLHDNSYHRQVYPSWIMTRDKLPFGDPSLRLKHRLNSDPLVSRSGIRCYFAHYGSKPEVSFGRTEDDHLDASLHARGIMLGEVSKNSTRMAHAIINQECIDILRIQAHRIDFLSIIWRILCADRDDKGGRAPHIYQEAIMHLLEIGVGQLTPSDSSDPLRRISSIDPEELLDSELPEPVEQFVKVIRDVLWNRRTFRLSKAGTDEFLVGLAPQHAKVGDHVCILYGCSVPVVLRKSQHSPDSWHLIGDAYVHGVMDGEAISASAHTPQYTERIFRII